jgi:hypothetical protein
MQTSAADHRPLTDMIPPPDSIRGRLAELTREANLLRQLLRVAERKERQQQAGRPENGGPNHAA